MSLYYQTVLIILIITLFHKLPLSALCHVPNLLMGLSQVLQRDCVTILSKPPNSTISGHVLRHVFRTFLCMSFWALKRHNTIQHYRLSTLVAPPVQNSLNNNMLLRLQHLRGIIDNKTPGLKKLNDRNQ